VDPGQPLELARDVARRFNQRFGETFPETAPVLTSAPKIMSPVDPTKKMSKSLGERHVIGVFEDEASFRKKIRSHVTDAGGAVRDETTLPPGVENLLVLLEAAAPPAVAEAFRAAERAGRLMYKDLKESVAEHLLALLGPIRERRASIPPERLRQVLRDGAERARASAAVVLADARERLGLVVSP
jgi:tryptophanyl-tRNA synthetase